MIQPHNLTSLCKIRLFFIIFISKCKKKEEGISDAPENDGNASMPEQVKRPNPRRKMMMFISSFYIYFLSLTFCYSQYKFFVFPFIHLSCSLKITVLLLLLYQFTISFISSPHIYSILHPPPLSLSLSLSDHSTSLDQPTQYDCMACV